MFPFFVILLVHFCLSAPISKQKMIKLEPILNTLHQGGTILYPTDTIWGIGCDASNADAIEKIYQIKQRDHSKSMLILCAGKAQAMLQEWESLLQPYFSGRPTTFIIPAEKLPFRLAENLLAADGTIGIRFPQHDFCQKLLNAFGKPIVSTSANFSGEPSPQHYEDISDKLKSKIDYCVPPLPEFESGEINGSRILKILPEGGVQVIRE